ncbi:putative ribonuclease H protein [Vitis vinifera]|uniref:Putative ribonuclease H protein n=1 Tax=Vitis vinifera TaxID=29760 RepID=A0A438GXT4_VITVI|nr:putative ribonuclease H protein [Vitis vinifera]
MLLSSLSLRRDLCCINGDEWGQGPGSGWFHCSILAKLLGDCQGGCLGYVQRFYDQNSFIKSLNHTFLVLIPKKGGAEDLGDYRPISLLGGLYKLLAKVLANRLKKIIDKVISPDQNAFIKGRQILDGSLIANEVIDSWQKRGEKGLICLHKMGFGSKWIGWMWSCISTIKYSMLVNGVPAGSFQVLKDMERKRAARNITHLLFADDTIVFCGTAAHCLFGAALGAPNRASSVWDGVEEKMRRKLALWKRHFLSKGGRITLIKSTLASIPLYQMSLFRMPKSVARRLEKLQRNFLWGGANGGNKAHLIKWEVVCTDKKKGGLGLRKLIWLNKALLGKWIWRFARAKEELWKKVLEAKYGKEEFGWRTRRQMGCLGFWIDPWCGNNVLSEAFPDLFSMAAQRNATVEDYWDQNLSQGGWSLRLLRDFNDLELGLVDNMLVELRNYRVSMEEDSVFWRGGADGLFKVKEAYRVLINADEATFPHSNVWVAKVPTKIIFFAWEATWGKVLTLDRCREEDGTFLIGASCVDVKRKLSIIF